MEAAGYTTLNRQLGLLREMQSIAHNVANMATTGYRAEGVIFSEYVADTGPDTPSLSLANGAVARTLHDQGAHRSTGAPLDFAIEGPGFFRLATAEGDVLTRAGHFVLSPDGIVVAPDGAALLDVGGAPIAVPLGAGALALGADGTLSAGGDPVAQIGLWQMVDPADRTRRDGVRFAPDGALEPIVDAKIAQGVLEASNVDPVQQIARMIEVQRAYELGQSFLDRDDERLRAAVRTMMS